MYVYYVYDDEWSDINGEEQLKEFAMQQAIEFYNTTDSLKEIESNINCFIEEQFKDIVKEIFNRLSKSLSTANIYELFNVNIAIQVLKLRGFDVKIVYVY